MRNPIDAATLSKVVQQCFLLSMSPGLDDATQTKLLAMGKRLRGSLMNLITADFADDVPELKDANDQLGKVNKRLAADVAHLEKIVEDVKLVSKLATMLDHLLELVLKVV